MDSNITPKSSPVQQVRATRYCLECHTAEHLGSSNAKLDFDHCPVCMKITNFGNNPNVVPNDLKKELLKKQLQQKEVLDENSGL